MFKPEELSAVILLIKNYFIGLFIKGEILWENDPEIADRRTLRFILKVSGKPKAVLKAEQQMKRYVYKVCGRDIFENVTFTYYWK